jgi:hypothetical protein
VVWCTEKGETEVQPLRRESGSTACFDQVKSCLILKYVKPDDRVFDLAMGKGGDLPKWKRAKIGSYFGADIARDSVQEHARTRYNQVCLALSYLLPHTTAVLLSARPHVDGSMRRVKRQFDVCLRERYLLGMDIHGAWLPVEAKRSSLVSGGLPVCPRS